MSVVVPAILPISREDLEEKLSRLSGLVSSVQIDSVDGHFASPASWPYTGGGAAELAEFADHGERLSHGGEFKLEIDLMTEDPARAAGTWLAAGASRLVVHADPARPLDAVFRNLEHVYGHDKDFSSGLLELGIGITPKTDLALIEPYLPHADFVQFMGIDTIGRQGQPFEPAVLQKIRMFRRRHPDMPVQVDGGVSKATAPALLSAGVSRLIVGYDLWGAGDLARELRELEELAGQYGIYE